MIDTHRIHLPQKHTEIPGLPQFIMTVEILHWIE